MQSDTVGLCNKQCPVCLLSVTISDETSGWVIEPNEPDDKAGEKVSLYISKLHKNLTQ